MSGEIGECRDCGSTHYDKVVVYRAMQYRDALRCMGCGLVIEVRM
jgi:uncharacterized Zn finger protein